MKNKTIRLFITAVLIFPAIVMNSSSVYGFTENTENNTEAEQTTIPGKYENTYRKQKYTGDTGSIFREASEIAEKLGMGPNHSFKESFSFDFLDATNGSPFNIDFNLSDDKNYNSATVYFRMGRTDLFNSSGGSDLIRKALKPICEVYGLNLKEITESTEDIRTRLDIEKMSLSRDGIEESEKVYFNGEKNSDSYLITVKAEDSERNEKNIEGLKEKFTEVFGDPSAISTEYNFGMFDQKKLTASAAYMGDKKGTVKKDFNLKLQFSKTNPEDLRSFMGVLPEELSGYTDRLVSEAVRMKSERDIKEASEKASQKKSDDNSSGDEDEIDGNDSESDVQEDGNDEAEKEKTVEIPSDKAIIVIRQKENFIYLTIRYKITAKTGKISR